MSGTGKGRASIHDVAREAGVSAATVSKVLRGDASVKAANAERIRAAVAKLDYRMDPLASGLRRATRRIIGLVVPELESEFFGRVASRFELLAEAAGYTLSIASSHESEARERLQIERLADWRVAGTILAPVRSERGAGAQVLKESRMTSVLIDRAVSDERLDVVSVDNAGASAAVARYLVDHGHRRILILGLNEVSKAVRQRISGVRDEIARLEVPVQIDTLLTDGTLEDLRSALARYLGASRPDAIYSLFQRGTLAAMSEFRRRDLRCPDEISLVGFDDAEWMQATYPAVGAVAQPVAAIVDEAFALLMRRIEGDDGPPVSRRLSCSFLPRESIGTLTPVGDALRSTA